jgi:DNA-binding CsgD family transcriptional regulator
MITLTKREVNVVEAISAGAVSGKEIAEVMGVGEQQVKKYLSRIYKKRNIKDKYE